MYQKYLADFTRVKETLENKYLHETREYAARKAFRSALVQKKQRTPQIWKLGSFAERQRAFATCIKWNWVCHKKYDDWMKASEAAAYQKQSSGDSLYERMKAEEAKLARQKKEQKEESKKKPRPPSTGPFTEMNLLGYRDHPLYSEPDDLDTALAVI